MKDKKTKSKSKSKQQRTKELAIRKALKSLVKKMHQKGLILTNVHCPCHQDLKKKKEAKKEGKKHSKDEKKKAKKQQKEQKKKHKAAKKLQKKHQKEDDECNCHLDEKEKVKGNREKQKVQGADPFASKFLFLD